MGTDMEISRDLVDLNISSQSAPLTSLIRLFGLLVVSVIIKVKLMMVPALKDLPLRVKSVLDELPIEIHDMSSHDVLDVKGQNIAWDVREIYVHVDYNLRSHEELLTF